MKAYNKQSLSELNYAGENFFHNFSAFDITDDETSWKSVESFFTDKAQTNSKITLIEKKVVSEEGQEQIVSGKMILEDQAVAESFNRF